MRRAIIAYLVLAVPLAADMLSFNSAEKWGQWQQPFGLVQVGEQGRPSAVATPPGTAVSIAASSTPPPAARQQDRCPPNRVTFTT